MQAWYRQRNDWLTSLPLSVYLPPSSCLPVYLPRLPVHYQKVCSPMLLVRLIMWLMYEIVWLSLPRCAPGLLGVCGGGKGEVCMCVGVGVGLFFPLSLSHFPSFPPFHFLPSLLLFIPHSDLFFLFLLFRPLPVSLLLLSLLLSIHPFLRKCLSPSISSFLHS